MVLTIICVVLISFIFGLAIGSSFEETEECKHSYKAHQDYCRTGQVSVYLQQFKCEHCGKLKNSYVN